MIIAAVFLMLGSAGAWAVQEPQQATLEERKKSAEELLKELANPLSALASLAILTDFDYHIGPGLDGHRTTVNLQPTLPVHLGDQWNLISRSNLPVIYQEEIAPGAGTQFGVGDVTEALYLAAVEPTGRGWIFGVGPVLRAPTGSDDLMTAGKWALGPSLAAVQLKGDFNYGLIASQLWSFAGSDKRSDIEIGTLEPFVTYRAENLWNLSLRVPTSYDFISHQWIIPVSLTVEKLVSFQAYPVTISFGLRYWADGPDNGPHDLAFRFGLTFVFPN